MSIFQTTKAGKCDVTVTLFNKANSMVMQRSFTYDVKPTLKGLKERFKPFKKELEAVTMRITSTPSCEVKTIKL